MAVNRKLIITGFFFVTVLLLISVVKDRPKPALRTQSGKSMHSEDSVETQLLCSLSEGPSHIAEGLANADDLTTQAWYRTAMNELLLLISMDYVGGNDNDDMKNYYSLDERLQHAKDGSLLESDAVTIAKMMRMCKPKTMLEVGSFIGMSSRWFMDVGSAWNATLTSVDPAIRHRIFDHPDHFVRQLNRCHSSKHERIRAFWMNYTWDGVAFDYLHYQPMRSPAAIKKIIDPIPILSPDILDHKFDLVFIDAYHQYEDAKNAYIGARKLLNNNGCIIFHDVTAAWPGVVQFIAELDELSSAENHEVFTEKGIALYKQLS